MPVEETDIILLDWWKNNEYRFPSSLRWLHSKQFYPPRPPRCRARVLCHRGRMHIDLRKSMKDSTLEHSLSLPPSTPFVSIRSFGFALLLGRVGPRAAVRVRGLREFIGEHVLVN